MTRSQLQQARRLYGRHRHPVKTFRGDPARPAYTLYSLWDYPTQLAAANELDELLDRWPENGQRTVALLAAYAAFEENGPPHWALELVLAANQQEPARLLDERQRRRDRDPALAARHAHHRGLAQAALRESQRRKQGPPTGTPRRLPRRGRVKYIGLPLAARRGDRPTGPSA